MTEVYDNQIGSAADKLDSEGQMALKLVKDYLKGLNQQMVSYQGDPGNLAEEFSSRAPKQSRKIQPILDDIRTKILPGLTNWQHPGFLSFYPASSSVPAILSELIIGAIGSVGLQWSANPIGTELECIVMDWLTDMLFPEAESPFKHGSGKGGGIIQNTAGEALAVIMVAARVACHKNLDPKLDRESLFYQDSSKLVVYMSDQTHFSGPKAVRVAGMRTRFIAADRLEDGNLGITSKQVLDAMDEDRKRGLIPCGLILNYGSTNTCGFDDLASFDGFCQKQNLWLHVDAAYAGASLILPEFKQDAQIMQRIATSFNFNGSKWFLCGFDSAFLFVRDRDLLKQVFAATGDYLDQDSNQHVYNPDFKDWSIPLGRKFRSLRIWMVLNYFGVEGIQDFIRQAIRQADWLRNEVDKSDYFKNLVQTNRSLVCIDIKDEYKKSLSWSKLLSSPALKESYLLNLSKLDGTPFLRVAMGGSYTQLEDIKKFWQHLNEAADR